MNKRKNLEKISSKYIVQLIIEYIDNDNWKMKLFKYSKYFQKIFQLKLIDYQIKFFHQKGIDFYKYLYYKSEKEKETFNKDILKEELKKDLLKYNTDLNIIKKFDINYFKEYITKIEGRKNNIYGDKDDGLITNNCSDNFLDIYSPFFDLISKGNIFSQFTISIPMNKFKKYNLEKDYISVFNKLNESNIKYSSLSFNYKNKDDFNYLKNLDINFNNIKNIRFNNLDHFLLYLNKEDKLPPSFIKINNFNFLQQLSLTNIFFEETFIIKINNLKILTLKLCRNVSLDISIGSKLKKLFLYDTFISIYSSGLRENLIKFPELEECQLINKKLYNRVFYCTFFDFSSSKKLKNITLEDQEFLYLQEKAPLEYIKLYSSLNRTVRFHYEKEIINKFMKIKTLKQVDIRESFNFDFLNVKVKNTSIKEIKFRWYKPGDCILYNIHNIFPNLSNLHLYIFSHNNDNKPDELNLEMIENPFNYINKIFLDLETSSNIKFYIGPYINLESLNIECKNKIKNLGDIIFFNNKQKILFRSLTHFRFIYNIKEGIHYNLLKNLYNNIDNMPNLRYFELECDTVDINENFYKELILKLIKLRLDKLTIIVKKSYNEEVLSFYSKNELKKLCPNIIFIDFNNIYIQKIK